MQNVRGATVLGVVASLLQLGFTLEPARPEFSAGAPQECVDFSGVWAGVCTVGPDRKKESHRVNLRQMGCQALMVNGELQGFGGVLTKHYANRLFNSQTVIRLSLVENGKTLQYETHYFVRAYRGGREHDLTPKRKGRAWIDPASGRLLSEEQDTRQGERRCVMQRQASN